MTVREMQLDDLSEVMEIENQNFSTPWTEMGFFSFFLRDDTLFLVAEEEGKILGYMGIMMVLDEGEITNVSVSKNSRRRGIGRALVGEMIHQMKKRGIKLGIATSNGRELVDETLKVLEIAEMFDSVVTAGEVGAGKPAPDVYLKVASEIGIDPARCLVFEDVPMGILAGKNAGMRVCAVEDDFSREQRSRKKELADYYICDYHEIKSESYEVL